jgi:hypothetical protein
MENFSKGKQLIGEVEFVICPYCEELNGKKKQILDGKHLKKHGKKLDDVRLEFSNHVTMTFDQYNKRVERGLSQKNSKKIVKCFYVEDEDCPGDSYEVIGTAPNYILCEHCKNIGKKNPDGRTKKEAYEKRKKVLKKKYGVSNPRLIEGVTEKISKTCKLKYGGVGFASTELAEKTREKIRSKYGDNNIMKTDIGKKVYKENFSKKYGTHITNPLHILEIAKRVSESLIGKTSNLKGKTYEEIHGPEKAKELIEDKRVSGVKSYMKKPMTTDDQKKLFDIIKQIFPFSEIEFCIIGEIEDYGKFGYALDIAIVEKKLCIEYDGWRHDLIDQKNHDNTRDKVLKDFGWNTLRLREIPTKEKLIELIKNII